MNLGAIFIGLALLVLAIPFVMSPFRNRSRQVFAVAPANNTSTGSSPEGALFALRDLEFDYQTEKITEEDYQNIRAALLAQAAEVIQSKQQEDAHIEEMIQTRRRGKAIEDNCPECGRHLHGEDKFCPGCGHARTILCPGCGRENISEDNFCTQCGYSLKEQTIQA